MPVRKPYVDPFRQRPSRVPQAQALTAHLAQRYEGIVATDTLSDRGHVQQFSVAAAAAYKELRGIRTVYRKALEAKAERIGQLTGRAFTVGLDAMQREQALEMAREARRDPAFKKALLDRLVNQRDDSPETLQLRRYFLNLDPMLSGFSEPTIDLLRLRLHPTLPAEVHALEVEMAQTRSDLAEIQLAMDTILPSCDRAVFEQLGIVGKPMSQWTPAERAEYIERVGLEAFQQDYVADAAFTALPSEGGIPASQRPEKHDDTLADEERRARFTHTELAALFPQGDRPQAA